MDHAIAACGQGKVAWSEKSETPALLSFEIRRCSLHKKGAMKREEYFAPLAKLDSFSPFLSQKLSRISGESFKSDLWHVVGPIVLFSFSLLSQGFSKLKLRFHDLFKLTWMWGWRCKDISSIPDSMFPPASCSTTGAWSGEEVRDPFAQIIFSLFWAR